MMNIFKVMKVSATDLVGGQIWSTENDDLAGVTAVNLMQSTGNAYTPTKPERTTIIEWPEVHTSGDSSEMYDLGLMDADGIVHIPIFEPGVNTGEAMGKYYGFPECCTHWFKHHRGLTALPDDYPLLGTGYVPCPECAKLAELELIANIQTNRVCTAPFPNGESQSNLEFFNYLVHSYQKPAIK